MNDTLNWMNGFGNIHMSEARSGALPQQQNSPQQPPYKLFAEQLSGTAFTKPRATNLHTWVYRLRPSVVHDAFIPADIPTALATPDWLDKQPPTQLRWDPLEIPNTPTHFLQGLIPIARNGDCHAQYGSTLYLYACNQSMTDACLASADGEWLIIPQQGSLLLITELGSLKIAPQQIAVIPRGIRFQVELLDAQARGYVCENFGQPFTLPELGPIGANGLANPKDFQYPTARFVEREGTFVWYQKFQNHWWQTTLAYHPCNVVAWRGNYAPYQYDLTLFNTINSVSFDHPDPSIFTVLTSPSDTLGVANVDLAIFPPRWQVAEHTFRPPYFHRNIMSEFMGLIHGVYESKQQGGFTAGGCSLHNCFIPHGPDAKTYRQATQAALTPTQIKHTLAFILESRYPWQVTQAMHVKRQLDYLDCWQDLN